MNINEPPDAWHKALATLPEAEQPAALEQARKTGAQFVAAFGELAVLVKLCPGLAAVQVRVLEELIARIVTTADLAVERS